MISRTLSFLLLLSLSLHVRSQQEYTLHFNRSMVQSSFTNPAFMTRHKVVISLPSLAYNYGNNAFSYKDLVRKDPSDDSTILDFDNIISKMSANNVLQMQSYLDWISIYISFKNWQFSYNSTTKVDFKLFYTKDMMSLLWNGNAQFIGQTVEIGPGLNMQMYREHGFRVARHFEKFDVGLRFKFLNGAANIYSVRNSMQLTTGSQNYASTLSTDYEVREAGIRGWDGADLLPFKSAPNKGYAFDIGGVYRINEKWEVTASVVDLGRIRWTDSVRIHKSNGSFSYNGIDIGDFIDNKNFDISALQDSLESLYFTTEKGKSYISNLVPKTYMSATFHPDAKTSFGALLHMEYLKGIHPGVGLYAGREFADFFTLGFSYAYKNKRFDNVGFNMNLGMPAFTLYLVTDNLLNFLRPGYGRNVTFRYGININISKLGSRRKKKKEKEEEEVEPSGGL